ncbi:MAG: hypothetical protein EOP10_22635 [Proteobacteria bacterium]|nr:MAG: hypothetical protein EOP10_22635 [Pseudomonadota bacterium]
MNTLFIQLIPIILVIAIGIAIPVGIWFMVIAGYKKVLSLRLDYEAKLLKLRKRSNDQISK